MKILNKVLGIALLALSFMLVSSHKTMAQDGGYVSDQEFYDDLQPYGTWINDPNYGNVWVPNVDEDFRPYATNGYWVQTDYGSTWVSNYPWGWATFHYGRWRYDDYYGWEWIPGHEWAPAWVSWRHGGGYYGWAPLTPGITISLSFGGGYHVPDNYWVCAPERDINRRDVYNYYAPPTRTVNIIHRTTIVKNTYVYNNNTYITGPRPRDIQQVTHQRVPVYKISNSNKPGTARVQQNTVNIYRPAVRKSPDAHPQRVVNAVAYKQANPNQGIGRRGAVAYNHNNAAKLAQVAHSSRPNTKVVKVNPVNNKRQGQPAGNRPNQPAVNNQPAQKRPNQPAINNQPGQPAGANRQRHGQPAAPATTHGTNKPAQNRPNQPVISNQLGQPAGANRQRHGQPAATATTHGTNNNAQVQQQVQQRKQAQQQKQVQQQQSRQQQAQQRLQQVRQQQQQGAQQQQQSRQQQAQQRLQQVRQQQQQGAQQQQQARQQQAQQQQQVRQQQQQQTRQQQQGAQQQQQARQQQAQQQQQARQQQQPQQQRQQQQQKAKQQQRQQQQKKQQQQ